MIREADVINFLICELLAKVGHHVSQLSGRDEAIAVLVEDLESLLNLLLGVGVLHLLGHEVQELREVDGARAVGVDLVNHVLELSLCGILPEGAHDGSQLLGGDGAIAVLVEEGESLLELGNLFLSKLIGLKKKKR